MLGIEKIKRIQERVIFIIMVAVFLCMFSCLCYAENVNQDISSEKSAKTAEQMIASSDSINRTVTIRQNYSIDTLKLFSFFSSILYSHDSAYVAKQLSYSMSTDVALEDLPLLSKGTSFKIESISRSNDTVCRVIISLYEDNNIDVPLAVAVISLQYINNDFRIIKCLIYFEAESFIKGMVNGFNNMSIKAEPSDPVVPEKQ
jgi:hypothetical protein